jgi:hypothetical protein
MSSHRRPAHQDRPRRRIAIGTDSPNFHGLVSNDAPNGRPNTIPNPYSEAMRGVPMMLRAQSSAPTDKRIPAMRAEFMVAR